MTLELIDFVVETDGVDLEDFPPEVQDRINGELAGLTESGPGNSPEPEDPPQSIVVDAGGGTEYTSIQTAIDEEATSGDVIFVEPGEYDESVTVDVEGVTIKGTSGGDVIINGSGKERGIDIKEDGVNISNLSIDSVGDGVSDNDVEGIFIGNASGFTNTNEEITINNVSITNIDGTDSGYSTEGIHVKHYNDGEPISGINIDNVTIDTVNSPTGTYDDGGRGANGVKLQADISDISITDTDIKNVTGGWGYGVVLTPSDNESGIPKNISFDSATIDTVSGSDYDSIGIGIDSLSGDPVSPENGEVADPDELSFTDTVIKNVDLGLVNKNTSKTLSNPNGITFESTGESVSNPTPDSG